MLKIEKELLKDILFEELYGLVLYYDMYAPQKDEFSFAFSEDRKNIVFKCVIENIWGNSCWEDSAEKREHTSLYSVNDYYIKEAIDRLVIQENEFKKYGVTENDLMSYYDNEPNYKYYLREDEERINYDYYYNHEVVRTTIIPVDEIAQILLDFKFTKPLADLQNSLEHIDFSKCPQIEEKLNNLIVEQNNANIDIEHIDNTVLSKNKIKM